jgi:hypothetical protein
MTQDSSISPADLEENELEADAQAWIRGDPKRQVITSTLRDVKCKLECLRFCAIADAVHTARAYRVATCMRAIWLPAGVVGPDEGEAEEDGCEPRKEVNMINNACLLSSRTTYHVAACCNVKPQVAFVMSMLIEPCTPRMPAE